MSGSIPAYLKAGGIAVITGAAQGGIGYEIASIALKRHSMKAVLVDQSKAALEATSKALISAGVPEEQFSTKTADVASYQQVQELADDVFKQHGKVDFLVLNAGTSVSSKSHGGDLEPWK
jgi:NADP-dependent 3-hydroxy acid dehydrogenase YdfG